jgi:hypothetical protein
VEYGRREKVLIERGSHVCECKIGPRVVYGRPVAVGKTGHEEFVHPRRNRRAPFSAIVLDIVALDNLFDLQHTTCRQTAASFTRTHEDCHGRRACCLSYLREVRKVLLALVHLIPALGVRLGDESVARVHGVTMTTVEQPLQRQSTK